MACIVVILSGSIRSDFVVFAGAGGEKVVDIWVASRPE